MNPTNPKTGQPQYVINEDDLGLLPDLAEKIDGMSEKEYHSKINRTEKSLLATFEYAAEGLKRGECAARMSRPSKDGRRRNCC